MRQHADIPELLISPLLKRLSSENLPCPLFPKEGKFLPFAKGGKEGLEGRCLDNYRPISNLGFMNQNRHVNARIIDLYDVFVTKILNSLEFCLDISNRFLNVRQGAIP